MIPASLAANSAGHHANSGSTRRRSRMADRTTVLVNSSLAAISEDVHKYMEEATKDELSIEYHRFNATLDLSTIDTQQHTLVESRSRRSCRVTILKIALVLTSSQRPHTRTAEAVCRDLGRFAEAEESNSHRGKPLRSESGIDVQDRRDSVRAKIFYLIAAQLKHHLQETHVVDDR